MNRRDFLQSAAMVGAAAVLMPKQTLARITPAEPRDDTAFVQSVLDRGEELPSGVYRVSAPLVLRSNARIEGSTFRFSRTVPHMLTAGPEVRNASVRYSAFYGHRPSFAERIMRRFAA